MILRYWLPLWLDATDECDTAANDALTGYAIRSNRAPTSCADNALKAWGFVPPQVAARKPPHQSGKIVIQFGFALWCEPRFSQRRPSMCVRIF